jgi:hypothetical protein
LNSLLVKRYKNSKNYRKGYASSINGYIFYFK